MNVSEIRLTGTAKDNYCIVENGDSLTGISCQNAQITAAELTGVSVKQTDSLTYNGKPQVADVEVKATTVNGNPVSFVYGVTAEQAADLATASPTVPAFTDAGEHRVYYVASASGHELETGRFPGISSTFQKGQYEMRAVIFGGGLP